MIQASCIKYSDVIRNIYLRNLIDYFFEQVSQISRNYNSFKYCIKNFKTPFSKFNTKKTILCDRKNNDNDFDSKNDNYVSLYEQNLGLNKSLPLTKLRTKVPLVENFNRSSIKLSEKQVNMSKLSILLVSFFFK
jgi:hypothetical protein